MLKIFKNKRAQNTAEYAILIALVVGGVIAMQTYAQRTLQGRLRDASVAFRDQTANMDGANSATTLQYEPYYAHTESNVDKTTTKFQNASDVSDTTLTTKRNDGSYVDETTYNNTLVTGGTEDELGAGF